MLKLLLFVLGLKFGEVRSFATFGKASGGNDADGILMSAMAGRSLYLRLPATPIIRGRRWTKEVGFVVFEPLEAVCVVVRPIKRVLGLSTGRFGLFKKVCNHNSHICVL